MSQRSQNGSGYWANQIIASALMTLLGFGGGVVILASDSEEKGQGVMLILTGLLFLGTLLWLVRQVRRGTREQRALYAWVILQHYPRRRSGGNVGSDLETMGLAARGRDGQLSLDEVLALQALRPEIPYPAALPESVELPPTPPAP